MSGFGGYGAAPPPGGAAPYPAGQEPGAIPVCPRHPDRVSYARCQRCGRPACPECQRPATVGFHCVDCAQAAAKSRTPVRTALGGPQGTGTPVVTLTIIVICAVLGVLPYVSETLYQRVAVELIFWPEFGLTEPYRFLTSTFLHNGIWHLAFNMYALWLIGQQLEVLLGRARFLTLYLLAAIGGSVGYLAIAGVDAVGAVGASGGVFGLFAAFAIFMRRLGRDPRPILVVIGINVVLGFVISNIAWQAHLGGMVVGAVVALIFARVQVRRVPAVPGPPGSPPGKPRVTGAALQWALCGAVLLVLIGIVVLVYTLAG